MLTALALKPLQPAQKVGPLSTQGHHFTFEPLGTLSGDMPGTAIGTLGRNTIAFDHFATPPTHGVKKLTGEQSVTTLTLHVLQDRTKRAIPPEQVTSGDPIAEELAKRADNPTRTFGSFSPGPHPLHDGHRRGGRKGPTNRNGTKPKPGT